MSDARADILGRVRSALNRRAGQAPTPAPAVRLNSRNLNTSESIELFIRSFEKLNGKAQRLARRADVTPALRDLLGGRTAVASNAPYLRECGVTDIEGVQTGFTGRDELRNACAAAGAGITSADYALADTGTLVMISSREEARLVSLLPPVHIAVVPAARMLGTLDELLMKLPRPAEQSSSMVLITGPSRTADIEQILVRGVHGPGEIYALIVEEGA